MRELLAFFQTNNIDAGPAPEGFPSGQGRSRFPMELAFPSKSSTAAPGQERRPVSRIPPIDKANWNDSS